MRNTGKVLVLRRVMPHDFDRESRKPKPSAFHLRHTECSLSVFAVGMMTTKGKVTPRRLLQDYLDGALDKLNSSDEVLKKKGENQLKTHGGTPEEMYDRNWRVAEIPVPTFTELGFDVLPPREEDGHQDVVGNKDDFEAYALHLRESSHVLSKDETLAI